ncbi:hypothetical protein IWX50DRAFT_436550 [Phyllosticta citricarpa]
MGGTAPWQYSGQEQHDFFWGGSLGRSGEFAGCGLRFHQWERFRFPQCRPWRIQGRKRGQQPHLVIDRTVKSPSSPVDSLLSSWSGCLKMRIVSTETALHKLAGLGELLPPTADCSINRGDGLQGRSTQASAVGTRRTFRALAFILSIASTSTCAVVATTVSTTNEDTLPPVHDQFAAAVTARFFFSFFFYFSSPLFSAPPGITRVYRSSRLDPYCSLAATRTGPALPLSDMT